MNPRSRLATFSLLLLFAAFFVFRPLSATDERTAARPLAEPPTAHNSTSLSRPHSPARPQARKLQRTKPHHCFLS